MGFFDKALKKFTETFDNIANEEELDALVAACVLIAAAEGGISEEEKQSAVTAISNHESLKSFKRDVIQAKFNSDANLINSDRELATGLLESKVSVVKETTARIRILGIMKQIAAADGNFSAEEEKVVSRIRKITG